jgi:phosphatidylinositol 3-kinase
MMDAIYRTLRRGKHRLLLWQGQEADGSVDTKTPSKVGLHDEMGRLEKVLLMSKFIRHALIPLQLMKKFERGDLPKNEWLDNMAFRRIEEIHAVSCERSSFGDLITYYVPQVEEAKSENLYLYIDLPRFDFPVIFNEQVRAKGYPSVFGLCPEVPKEASLPIYPFTSNAPNATQPPPQPLVNINTDPHLWQILDPDMILENPVEDKHRRLVRSHRSGPLDREMKPNAAIRDELNVSRVNYRFAKLTLILAQDILNYAPTQTLSSEEKDLIWKFRFYLTRDKRGLTKFLKSVTWRDPSEVKQAVEVLLPLWTEVDTDDALELLGPNTVDSRVRSFAVKQLRRADDDVRLSLIRALAYTHVVGDRNSPCTYYNLYKP